MARWACRHGRRHPSPTATSLPMTIGLAAGFDPDLAHSYEDIIGSETATLGQHVLEGPGVCLHRTTIAGRNSDTSPRPVPLRGDGGRGDQGHPGSRRDRHGQHYVVNDQEYERFRASVEVDEHVLCVSLPVAVRDAGQGRRDRRGDERLPTGSGACTRPSTGTP